MKMNEVDLSYVAGVLDGDGSFSLIKRKPRKEGESPIYYPMIQICNLSKNLMDFLVKKLGGIVHTRKSRIGIDGSKRKEVYTWNIQKSPMCLPFLELISPKLVVKKERAEFLKYFIKNNPFLRGSNKVPFDVLQDREKSYIKMKMFNDERKLNCKLSKTKVSELNTSPEFLSYMCGLLDTDGSFSIKKEKRKNECKSAVYSLIVSLSMTDIKGLNRIIENCPYGNITTIKAKTCRTGFTYRWGLYGKKDMTSFLEEILPYIRLKKDKVKIMLEFINGFTPTAYCREGVSQENIDFRESCYQRMQLCENMGSINLL